jgi:thioredoxin-like negative regulator of GroEL
MFMLKNLIILLVVVILIAVGLNFNNFSTENTTTQPIQETKMQTVVTKPIQEEKKVPIKTVETTLSPLLSTENNLTKEIQALIKEANLLFQKSKDDEAMAVYFKIIKKTENSTDPKILKQFSEAYLQIAFLYQIYPHLDKDASIEAYEMIINKFKNSTDSELLGSYINAKIQQAYLFTKEERLDTYDELIKKFENHKDLGLQKKIEELLITKSFDLMGKNDEEAMEILDTLIDKYKSKENTLLPEQIELAILNNLELAIITNNDDDKYRDLANEYLLDSPDTKPLLDMLNIIKNAQDLNQDEALVRWKEEHKNYRFKDWSFQELRRWISKVEDKETREQVVKYLDAFENHKYNINSKTKLPYTKPIDETETIILPPLKYIMTEEEQAKHEEEIEYETPYLDPYSSDSQIEEEGLF